MRKESFQGILLGIVIMCAVFAFITVAWAAFQSTLEISGTATVQSVTWKVKFSEDGSTEPGTGGVALTGTTHSTNAALPESNGLKISQDGLSVSGNVGTFSSNGDKITYNWYLVNYGDFNASITSTSLVDVGSDTARKNISLTCTSSGGSSGDRNTWCADNLTARLYVETYSTGTVTPSNMAIPSGDPLTYTLAGGLPSAVGATENSNKKRIFLVVEYTGNEAADSNITVSLPTITFTAQQNGAKVVSS